MTEEEKEQINEDEEDEGINLLDYLIILAKHKKLIIVSTLSVAIISGIISLLSSISFYMATTSILPPQKQQLNLANRFITEFGIFPSMGSNVPSQQELLVEIIKSRTFSDRLLERFNLKAGYEAEDMEEAREMLSQNIIIEPDFTDKNRSLLMRGKQSPLTRITVIDQNPEKAANMANAIVEELKVFVNNIAISEASQRRLFFEEQLKHVNEALMQSEDDVIMFQKKHGILKVESETSMVIGSIANLQANIAANEIQLQVMKSYSTASNPDVQKVEEKIKVLRKELAKLKATEQNSNDLLIPTGKIPALGLEYKRILRELKFNEALYEIMIKQFEAAKIDESKESALIQVIDKAIPPEVPATMRTFGLMKALAATVFVFFFSCFLAFAFELHERYSESGEHNERFEILMRYLSFKGHK
jgi:capsule polysaccharide export protein KpsE/RkpR